VVGAPIEQAKREALSNFILKEIKTLLKHLSELQQNEPMILFDSLAPYIETCAKILYNSSVFSKKIRTLALLSLYRVLTTNVYNTPLEARNGKAQHSDIGGVLASPTKYKNLEPQLQQAIEQYLHVMGSPVQQS